jgi:catechol O-methyltransferase
MLHGASPRYLHVLQNVALLLLTLVFLPLSTAMLGLSYASRSRSTFNAARQRIRARPSFRPKTILVTGVNMAKGLAVARAFHEAGHDVIGADFEPYGLPIPARFSRALRTFYRLPQPTAEDGATVYIDTLLQIIHRERVVLWVSCSGVFTAMEDAQAKEVIDRSGCVSIQFDVATTSGLHQKHIFIPRARDLGFPVPETYQLTAKDDAHEILQRLAASQTKFILKSVATADAFRTDFTLLPRDTQSETDKHLSRLPISKSTPWVLQEYIRGKEYCTHALIVNNVVKAFVACPSSDLLMQYQALPRHSALNIALQRFTQEFAARSEPGMTGHLSFDFMVKEEPSDAGVHLGLRVIECNPRAHTAVVLLAGRSHEMAEAYLSALPLDINGHGPPNPQSQSTRIASDVSNDGQQPIVTPREDQPAVYWIGHEIVTLLCLPLVERQFSAWTYLTNVATLLQRVMFWTDAVYAGWDPLPFWWLYHVYWPGLLVASAWAGKKWSRLNMCIGRIIEC